MINVLYRLISNSLNKLSFFSKDRKLLQKNFSSLEAIRHLPLKPFFKKNRNSITLFLRHIFFLFWKWDKFMILCWKEAQWEMGPLSCSMVKKRRNIFVDFLLSDCFTIPFYDIEDSLRPALVYTFMIVVYLNWYNWL